MNNSVPVNVIKRKAMIVLLIIFVICLVPLVLSIFHIISRDWLYLYVLAFALAIGGIVWELFMPAGFISLAEFVSIFCKFAFHAIGGVFAGGILVKVVLSIGLILPATYVAATGFMIYSISAFFLIRILRRKRE